MHKSRGIACSVHGDDFTSTGSKVELDCLEDQLEGKYELRKGDRVGPGADDAKELTVPNCVLRYTPQGFKYEADLRLAEKLLEGLKLDGGCDGAATPGLKPFLEQPKKDAVLPSWSHAEFRGFAARANYRLTDRIDLQLSAKEICGFTSAPTDTSMLALKRMGRYLLGHKCLVYSGP